MRRLLAVVFLAAMVAGSAQAVCPAPGLLLNCAKNATSVHLVSLGSRAERSTNPLNRPSDRFIGYSTRIRYPLTGKVIAAMGRTFGDKASYLCGDKQSPPAFETKLPTQVGVIFDSPSGRLRAVLRLPEGDVDLEYESGYRAEARLSSAGQARWEEALGQLLRATSKSKEDFYADMAPPEAEPERAGASAGSSGGDVKAFALTRVPPSYPDLAREAGVDGIVIVAAHVSADGTVIDTRIEKSIPMLDTAAKDAVRKWRFQPATSNGQPVDSWIAVPVKFSLH